MVALLSAVVKCFRAWVSVEILWRRVLLPLLAVAGRCYRAQPLINIQGATKHKQCLTCAAELFYLRHVRSCAAPAFWKSIHVFRNGMRHMGDRGLGDTENHNGDAEMALQIPRLNGRASVGDSRHLKGHLSPASASASKSTSPSPSLLSSPSPVADHRYHYNRRRHRCHNLSTFIIILTRVLSASTTSSSSSSSSISDRCQRTLIKMLFRVSLPQVRSIKADDCVTEFRIRCPDFAPRILHPVAPDFAARILPLDFAPRGWLRDRVPKPLPGFCPPGILPPGFCPPWVSAWPSSDFVAQILSPGFCLPNFAPRLWVLLRVPYPLPGPTEVQRRCTFGSPSWCHLSPIKGPHPFWTPKREGETGDPFLRLW